MRGTFARTLADLAEQDDRVLLLTGDLGFMALEPFSERHPGRFFNVGVAEQDMVGISTGLAEAGFLPFAYSIATFATLRALEFMRNGPLLHGLPVRLVGVGGGFEYGTAGPTHHALEDLAVMRALEGVRVIAPADFEHARAALLATWDSPGPVYYRLGKDDRTVVPGLDGRFRPGQVELIGSGGDVLLVATGAITVEAAAALDLLAARGIHATLAVVAELSPAPAESLAAALAPFATVMTVEAHGINGGLGSLVAEIIAEAGLGCRLRRAGGRLESGRSGSQAWMQRAHGLDRECLADKVVESLAMRR